MSNFIVINTGNRGTFPNVMHDAAAPFAVAEIAERGHMAIRSIRTRKTTMRAAQISAGLARAAQARGD